MSELPKFRVVLPTGQKTKPYSKAKITAAVEGGKLPVDANVESPDGSKLLPIQEFCFGQKPQQQTPPEMELVERRPAPPKGKAKMSYFLARRGMPEAVKLTYGKLSRDEQVAFEKDFKRRCKSTITAYIAWILLGWHYLYAGKIGLQFAFWFTLGGFGVWWLIDLFRVPGVVRHRNEEIARTLLAEQRMMS